MSDLYQIAQSVRSGSSGKGNTFWEVSANCGHQRLLENTMGQNRHAEKDWAIRGTYYHLLHQWWQEGRVPEGHILELRNNDQYWDEAVTLFNWYVENYPKDGWGTCLGTEVQVPATPAHQAAVAEFFGVPQDFCPTGRYDLCTVMDEAQVERAGAAFGVLLPGPGRYIVDYKHGKQHNFDDETKFTQGPQPLMYLTLDRLLNPSNPARGMIFTKVSMTKEKGALKKKDTSFRVYVATWQPNMLQRCRQSVQFAYQQMIADTYNGYACLDCPFFQKECQGFKP